MKNTVEKSMIIFFFFLMTACGNKSTESSDAEQKEHSHDGSEHQHVYACPMHPEVTGKEGEKCSKCGMPLEHNDEAGVKGNYEMKFTSSPQEVEAGKPVTLSLTPKNRDKADDAVPLDVEHEKKIHLIIVNDDLSWFLHTHPEYNADGSYTVTETLPAGGNYIMYADYKPSGANHQLEKITINAKGNVGQVKTFNEPIVTSSSGAYSVTLKPDDGKFIANKAIHFDGVLMKDGKPYDVNNLENYLGAKGHMVGIKVDTKEYIHLHPEVENTILHFHTTFENPGLYRAWLQFMADGKLHTTDFVINVEQGEKTSSSESHAPKDHSH